MHIKLSPCRCDTPLTLSKAGDVLTINGEVFDFAAIPEGATLPREAVDCDWLASDVTREGGDLHLTLILPHGAVAPIETLFPDPISDPADGPIPLPPYEEEAEE